MLNRTSSLFSSREDYRLFLLSSFVTVVFFTLLLRLFYLQVVRGQDMERRAKMNSTQVLPLLAPRGLVFARDGNTDEPLLENAPRFSLYYSYSDKATTSIESIKRELSERLPESFKIIQQKLAEARKSGKITRVLTDIPSPVALALMERRLFLPGVNILVEPQRRPRYGFLACHILGYAGEVDETELRRSRDQGLRHGQWVGKNGIERVYDELLRGTDGGLQFEVDAMGRHLQVVRRIPSSPGNDVYLTINRRLQSVAEAGLAASISGRGAAVALDPQTGAVLALASAPGYDSSGNLGAYLSDQALPLFNRAIQGIYPPGSVFKIVTAATGLQDIDWDTRKSFLCTGSYRLGDREFGCWNKHGQKEFFGAVAFSCNIYFYNIGRALGPDPIEAMAKAFGFGEKTGIELAGESSGLVPGRSWKKKVMRQGWFEGDTLNFSIGQGAMTATPLQAAVFFAALANGGTVWRPYVVDRVVSPENKILFHQNPDPRQRVVLKETVWATLRRAMEGVVLEGSGRGVQRSDLVIGAKTGTAQNPHGEDHSWFTAYAGRPGQKPGLALAVFVENGGHGSVSAGPIARAMINEFYPRESL
jgi:penicillin-binding protein 2